MLDVERTSGCRIYILDFIVSTKSSGVLSFFADMDFLMLLLTLYHTHICLQS